MIDAIKNTAKTNNDMQLRQIIEHPSTYLHPNFCIMDLADRIKEKTLFGYQKVILSFGHAEIHGNCKCGASRELVMEHLAEAIRNLKIEGAKRIYVCDPVIYPHPEIERERVMTS